MLNDWKETTLGEVISSGLAFNYNNLRFPLSGEERLKRQGKYPYYGAASAIDCIDDYRFDGFYLLIAEDGTVYDGKSPMLQLVRGRFWVSNHSHVLQGKDEITTRFLFYLLKNVSIAPYITGAVQPKLSKENLYRISFCIPENESEQKAIATVLSSFDDKIELLRRQNKTLEKIAQTIFKEWFVNFTINGKNLKINNSTGLPEGWRMGKLGEEFEIVMGQSPDGASYNESCEGMIFFQGRTDFQERFPAIRLYTTEPKRIAERFDVLVSVRAPVGDINVASDRCCIGRGLGAVRGKCKSYTLYKIQSLQGDFNKFEAEGTVFGSIGKDSFADIEAIIPDNETVTAFEAIASNIDAKIFTNNSQIQTLSKLRDLLLPKLMKGEIRVK